MELVVEAKRVVLQALKEKVSPFQVARFIRKHFNEKYGGHWACIINKIGGHSYSYKTGFSINMKIGPLNVEISKK